MRIGWLVVVERWGERVVKTTQLVILALLRKNEQRGQNTNIASRTMIFDRYFNEIIIKFTIAMIGSIINKASGHGLWRISTIYQLIFLLSSSLFIVSMLCCQCPSCVVPLVGFLAFKQITAVTNFLSLKMAYNKPQNEKIIHHHTTSINQRVIY